MWVHSDSRKRRNDIKGGFLYIFSHPLFILKNILTLVSEKFSFKNCDYDFIGNAC